MLQNSGEVGLSALTEGQKHDIEALSGLTISFGPLSKGYTFMLTFEYKHIIMNENR